jgi:flavin-binding protein dodecin
MVSALQGEECEAMPTNGGPSALEARRDAESVYQVIQLVGSSAESWELAAQSAIAEAAKTIGDLRVAQVVELDTHVVGGEVRHYRLRLKVSYRIDRSRRSPETGEAELVRRYLVVANQTVGGAALTRVIRQRMDAGPAEFHVLVPATFSRDYASARRLSSLGVDPMSGYTFGDLTPLAGPDEEGLEQARDRLAEQLLALGGAGARSTGEIGDPDTMAAIATVLSRGSFDEIILSTLPSSVSRWVKMDLPSRVERRFQLPVSHVEGNAP